MLAVVEQSLESQKNSAKLRGHRGGTTINAPRMRTTNKTALIRSGKFTQISVRRFLNTKIDAKRAAPAALSHTLFWPLGVSIPLRSCHVQRTIASTLGSFIQCALASNFSERSERQGLRQSFKYVHRTTMFKPTQKKKSRNAITLKLPVLSTNGCFHCAI